jgi:alkanesulfonate monooxygenase SsuD/methylene tetrahydromethanopterin reductase-like flavin-dependent oxidoreductase (luciferase family)
MEYGAHLPPISCRGEGMYVTEKRGDATHMLERVLAPMLHRPTGALRGKLPVGPPEECAAQLRRYRRAGAQHVFLWPMATEGSAGPWTVRE